MSEITVQLHGTTLHPVTDADIELLRGHRQGQGFRVEIKRVSDRSLRHHRLYFGGLVRLVAEYWESESGLISVYDKKVMKGLLDWVAKQGQDTHTLESIVNLYLEDRAEKIKQYLPEHEKAAVKLQTIHDWLKEQAGYYDVVMTPTGIHKKIKSINFNAMRSQEEFDKFYRDVFGVAWRYVLSKAQFESQAHAEQIALEMAAMG